MNETQREYKVYKIESGTVIDHIPHWKALEVIELLRLRSSEGLVTLGIGLSSAKMGQKDLLKIEQRQLTPQEMHQLALVAPQATVNLIQDGGRTHKQKVVLPDRIDRLVRCSNIGCITRHEAVPTRFITVSRQPIALRCHYCNWITPEEEIELL